ncbi:MAG TPA: T9SS type A sorting domain-containing protein [Bacteroidota bacterium]|nr:T9SS type A sorting domain-containing protein [Bacteroidota bacterium]
MKQLILSLLVFIIANGALAQKQNHISFVVDTAAAVATESWHAVLNNDTSNYGNEVFVKYSDGSIKTNGIWYYGGTECPYQGGTMTISDTTFSFTAQGTAVNLSAPAGYQTSAFTLSVSGSANNGISYSTWSIAFTSNTRNWPTSLNGSAYAMRISGNGVTNSTTSVAQTAGSASPKTAVVFQNYPNPFNPTTVIKYSVPVYSTVTLKVYDIVGREVATLVNETKNAGSYEATFHASPFASGVYFYTLTAGKFQATKKLLLLK